MLAIAAVSTRTKTGFWVAAPFAVGWLALTRELYARDPRPGALRALVLGDTVIVLGALTLTGYDDSDLRYAVIGLPAAWALLYTARSILVTAPLAVVVYGTFFSRFFTDDGWPRETAIFSLALAGTCALAYVAARENEVVAQRVQDLEDDRRALLADALAAEERERRRLAEILHDDSLQFLLAAAQDLHEVGERGDEREAEALRSARSNLGHALTNLRGTVRTMHPLALATGDLEATLQTLCDTLGRRGRFATDLRVAPGAGGVLDEQVVSLVRELLTNAAKHAHADVVLIDVTANRGGVAVRVHDDGVGFAAERPDAARAGGHIGLALARERVASAGGTWELRSAPGEGVDISFTLPAAPRPAAPAAPPAVPPASSR